MRAILCLIAASCLLGSVHQSRAQTTPYQTFLEQNKLTAVPLLDQQKVSPGLVYTVSNSGSYLSVPTKMALGSPVDTTSPEVPKQTFSQQKDRNIVLKVLFGIGGGTGSSQSFDIEETTLTCKAIPSGDGGPLDKLVYTDPDFKASIGTALNGYGTAELISDVCWATKFKMTQESSRAIYAAINADPKSCPAAAPAQKPPAAPGSDGGANSGGAETHKTGNNGTPGSTPPAVNNAAAPATSNKPSPVAALLAKSNTVGDLIKSLQEAAQTALAGSSIQAKSCTSEKNTVELDASVPVAIAMKTWLVYSCGPGTPNACVNPKAADPNMLEYREDSNPKFF